MFVSTLHNTNNTCYAISILQAFAEVVESIYPDVNERRQLLNKYKNNPFLNRVLELRLKNEIFGDTAEIFGVPRNSYDQKDVMDVLKYVLTQKEFGLHGNSFLDNKLKIVYENGRGKQRILHDWDLLYIGSELELQAVTFYQELQTFIPFGHVQSESYDNSVASDQLRSFSARGPLAILYFTYNRLQGEGFNPNPSPIPMEIGNQDNPEEPHLFLKALILHEPGVIRPARPGHDFTTEVKSGHYVTLLVDKEIIVNDYQKQRLHGRLENYLSDSSAVVGFYTTTPSSPLRRCKWTEDPEQDIQMQIQTQEDLMYSLQQETERKENKNKNKNEKTKTKKTKKKKKEEEPPTCTVKRERQEMQEARQDVPSVSPISSLSPSSLSSPAPVVEVTSFASPQIPKMEETPRSTAKLHVETVFLSELWTYWEAECKVHPTIKNSWETFACSFIKSLVYQHMITSKDIKRFSLNNIEQQTIPSDGLWKYLHAWFQWIVDNKTAFMFDGISEPAHQIADLSLYMLEWEKKRLWTDMYNTYQEIIQRLQAEHPRVHIYQFVIEPLVDGGVTLSDADSPLCFGIVYLLDVNPST